MRNQFVICRLGSEPMVIHLRGQQKSPVNRQGACMAFYYSGFWLQPKNPKAPPSLTEVSCSTVHSCDPVQVLCVCVRCLSPWATCFCGFVLKQDPRIVLSLQPARPSWFEASQWRQWKTEANRAESFNFRQGDWNAAPAASTRAGCLRVCVSACIAVILWKMVYTRCVLADWCVLSPIVSEWPRLANYWDSTPSRSSSWGGQNLHPPPLITMPN